MEIPLRDINPPDSLASRIGDASREPAQIQQVVRILGMSPHPEGGYFAETDRDQRQVDRGPSGQLQSALPTTPSSDQRSVSTNIFYLLTPWSPVGGFHRNLSRTIHTLHRGRGIYVVLTEKDGGVHIETFVVGQDIEKGERLQWIVDGGSYKASYLVPEKKDDPQSSSGLLISETVIPGFDYQDHNFLRRDDLRTMVDEESFEQMKWLLRENFL